MNSNYLAHPNKNCGNKNWKYTSIQALALPCRLIYAWKVLLIANFFIIASHFTSKKWTILALQLTIFSIHKLLCFSMYNLRL